MAHTKTTWNVAALFIIVLVVSFPIYSANALAAAVQITQNHGEDGISGFIDSEQDLWTVEAKISDVGEDLLPVENDELIIEVDGGPDQEFDQCEDRNGEAFCTITTVVAGIEPGTRPFKVTYNNLFDDPVSANSLIHADSRAPEITINGVEQVREEIIVNVEVEDPKEDGRCVGLRSVELIDADSFQAFDKIEQFPNDPCKLVYAQPLPLSLNGEGRRHLKVRAVDLLGHETVSEAEPFETDFVAPQILLDSVNLTESQGFIGQASLPTDITVIVLEKNGEFAICDGNVECGVTATSEHINFRANGKALCERLVETEDIVDDWICTWSGAEIASQETISMNIQAVDVDGNVATATKIIRLVKDESSPQLIFFGTERTFLDEGYVTNEEITIVARITDEGSGIDVDGVVADLSGLNRGRNGLSDLHPETCVSEAGAFLCTWKPIQGRFASDGTVVIKLSELVDRSGNKNRGANEVTLQVDIQRPLIRSVELFAVSPTIGKKSFFQSGDDVQLELEIEDRAGLFIQVDTSRFINDLGIVNFTDLDCSQAESENWKCALSLPKSLKSSIGEIALIEILVFDTAGNREEASSWPDAENLNRVNAGKYTFELLGSDEQTSPDFWGNKDPKPLLEFVDLDTVQLIPARMPVSLKFNSSDARIELVQVVVPQGACAPVVATSPQIQNVVLYSGVDPSGETNPTVEFFVEFQPFSPRDAISFDVDEEEFETADVEYKCQFQLFSKTGNTATRDAEVQQFTLSVPFGFSELGALDENIEGRLDEIRDEWAFALADKVAGVSKLLSYVKWVADLINIYYGAINVYNVWNGAAEGLRTIPAIGAVSAFGICTGATKAEDDLKRIPELLQVPLSILSCNPNPVLGTGYANYQKFLLNWYNAYTGKGFIGKGATSLYDNIYLSTAGLCLPGIFYNLEKYRQVRCREMLCYQNEIPAGIATWESCRQLGEYLECRYVFGPIYPPIIQAYDVVIEWMKNWYANIENPLTIIKVGPQLVCLASCAISNTDAAACTFTGTILKLFDLFETLVGTFNSYPSKVNDVYCSQLTEPSEEAPAPEVADA